MMSAGDVRNIEGCRANTECKAVLEQIETACTAKPNAAKQRECRDTYLDSDNPPTDVKAASKDVKLTPSQYANWVGFLNTQKWNGQDLPAPAAASPNPNPQTPAPAASASVAASADTPPPAAASNSSSSAVAPLMIGANATYNWGNISFDSGFTGPQFGNAGTQPQGLGNWGMGFQLGYLIPGNSKFSIGPTLGFAYSALRNIEHPGYLTKSEPANGGLKMFSLGALGAYSPTPYLLTTLGVNGNYGWGNVMAGFAGSEDATHLFGIGGMLGVYGLPNRHFAIGLNFGYDYLFTGNQQLDSELAANKSNSGSGGLFRIGLGIMGFIDVTSSEKK